MATIRKLQAEIDKTFRKVDEQQEVFQQIFDRLKECDSSLKEKYEVDVSDLHNSLAALSKLSTTGGAGGEDLLTFMKIYCIILSPSFIYHFQVFSIFFTMIGSFL